MRLLLLTEFLYDFSTFRLVLENLAEIYSNHGHHVETAGQSGRRKPRSTAAPWGRIIRLAGRVPPALMDGIDAAHLHTTGYWTPVLASIDDAALSMPLVVTFQDWDNPNLPANDSRALRRWTKLLESAAAVTAVSHGVAARLSSSIPSIRKRVHVIPNGVDASMFQKERPLARGPSPFILCPARLASYKGIDLALMAWKDVSSVKNEVDLVFAGRDHARGQFQRLARLLGLSSRTRFLGEVGRRKMRELMGSCLFAILPSRHEAFGIVALEAMAGGKAVLATRTDGPSDVVIHGSTGLLVRPGSVDQLRDGIAALLANSRRRDLMGRKGKRRAKTFRWESIAKSYLRLYSGEKK